MKKMQVADRKPVDTPLRVIGYPLQRFVKAMSGVAVTKRVIHQQTFANACATCIEREHFPVGVFCLQFFLSRFGGQVHDRGQ